MLFISTVSYYDNNNEFRLKEILVSDGKVTYSLAPDDGFSYHQFPISLTDIMESARDNISYPILGFNKVRRYDDDDPKALAMFLSKKFRALGNISPRDEKVVFDIMTGFGHE